MPDTTIPVGSTGLALRGFDTGAGIDEYVRITETATTPKTVDVSSSGTTELHAPAAGTAIRLHWIGVSGDPDNTAKVKVGFRWTTGGTDFLSTYISQYGGVFAHHYKAGATFIQGAVDEPLVVNLSAAQAVSVNFDYEEV